MTLSHTVTSFSNLSIPPLTPFLREDLLLSHAQIGLLMSFFYVGVVSASIFFGWGTDLLGERRTLILGLGIQGLFMIGFAWTSTFIVGGLFLLMAGVGYSSVSPATTKGIIRWFPPQGRATAMGVKQTGIPLGGILASSILPGLALSIGWRFSILLGSVLTLSAVSLVRACVPPGALSVRGPSERFWKQLYEVLSNRNMVAISVMGIFLAGVQLSVVTHLVLFLKSKFLFSSVLAGICLALSQAGGIAGRIGWGLVSDFLAGGKRKPVFVVIGLIASAQLFLLAHLGQDRLGNYLFLVVFLLGGTAIGFHGILYGLLGELVRKELVGLATGFSLTITFLGIIIFPPLFGTIVDRLGSYTQAWDLMAFSWVMGLLILIFFVREDRPEKISTP
jgi:sugar phosphate permease